MNEKNGGKILIYARINSDDPVNLGAVKKYHGLLGGFRKLGYQADLLWLSEKGLLLNNDTCFRFRLNPSMESMRNVLFNYLLLDRQILQNIDFSGYQIFFVRFPLCHPMFIFLLWKAKKQNPGLKIWLEVPTFPYETELRGGLRWLQYRLDRFLQPLLRKYVDIVVNYGQFKSMFGIPCFGIENGVDVSALPVSASSPQVGRLRLLAVGNWNYWHGLDRLITGLATFYASKTSTVKVELTIAGGGRQLNYYKELVKTNRLSGAVRFLPPMQGPELDTLFDQADIAVGCLGLFRKKVKIDSSLKHREYAARAIPILMSSNDLDFPKRLGWVFSLPETDSAVNVNELITFFEILRHNHTLKTMIRQYAVEHLDWCVKLKKLPLT